MSIINHRGPIGLDDHFSWLEPDYADPPFDVTAFLYHGTDVTPGPRGMPGTVASLDPERHLADPAGEQTGLKSLKSDLSDCNTIAAILFYTPYCTALPEE